jgi:serine/threonine protein kinase
MMTDDSNNSMPKIVDFGFAKIIGPEVTDCDYFGSQGYAAPEVVTKSDYNL